MEENDEIKQKNITKQYITINLKKEEILLKISRRCFSKRYNSRNR